LVTKIILRVPRDTSTIRAKKIKRGRITNVKRSVWMNSIIPGMSVKMLQSY